jgi:hypothetical protein
LFEVLTAVNMKSSVTCSSVTFLRNMWPPSSGSKGKLSQKEAWRRLAWTRKDGVISHSGSPGSTSDHVGFVVNKVALGSGISKYFRLPCQFSIHQLLHNH